MNRQSQEQPQVGRPRDETLISERREQILAAATRIFAQQGYRQTDVQAVADQIGVGKGTVYRYFPTKEALFLAAVDRGVQELTRRVDAATADISDPLERLATAVRAYLAFFDDHGEVVELLILERAEFKDRKPSTYFVHKEACLAESQSRLEDLMADGRLRKIPAGRVLDVLSDLLYGAIFTNRMAGRSKRFDTQADDILDIVLHGILACDSK